VNVSDEYKALTNVNLPFLEERYEAGKMIPRSRIEKYVEVATATLDDRTAKDPHASPLPTADSVIEELMSNGSISDDPDAQLHPDHLPVDPNKPSVQRLVAQANALIEHLEEQGVDVPAKLRSFADMSDRQIDAADTAQSREEGRVD
jgi:hypothetical protein